MNPIPINGKTLKDWGIPSNPRFKEMIADAREMESLGMSSPEIIKFLHTMLPQTTPLKVEPSPLYQFIDNPDPAIVGTMQALMHLPTVLSGQLMPDACHAGTIPVGGVVTTEGTIHPGFHSADVCCSMGLSVFAGRPDPKEVLDKVHLRAHFGAGGRKEVLGTPLKLDFTNPFLKGLENYATYHYATQGDGNHFAYVGFVASTGRVALVTHHGSRGLGAQLYKRGMAAAIRHTSKLCPEAPPATSWLDASSVEGQLYWDALYHVGQWTYESHFALHDALGYSVHHRQWNEHNFVFQTGNMFHHAKGATPSWIPGLIPMNMASPILMANPGRDMAAKFAPHGAGRDMSRTAFLKANEGLDIEAETKGLDIRSFSGKLDLSELPSAYKSADDVIRQIEKYNLTTVVDKIVPYGSIMAGANTWTHKKSSTRSSPT